MNAWIAQARSDPNKLPGEYVALGVGQPQDWTLEDSIAVGVYLARTIPSGTGAQLDNLRAFQAMGPAAFDRLLPLHTPHPVITVPRSSGLFPSDPGRTRKQERTALKRSTASRARCRRRPRTTRASRPRARRRLPLLGHVGLPEGSDVWAIRGPHHQARAVQRARSSATRSRSCSSSSRCTGRDSTPAG